MTRYHINILQGLWTVMLKLKYSLLKSNVLKCIFASGCMSLEKPIQTDRQTDILIYINGEVKWQSFYQK